MPDLRDQLDQAILDDDDERALALYDELAEKYPEEPRWPHRRGELLLRMEEEEKALDSFEQAVDLYAAEGFIAKAAALAKMMLEVAPDREAVLERVDPAAARELRRRHRPGDVGEHAERLLSTPPLAPAPQSDPDELRFSDLPDDEAIPIDLTELEVSVVPPPLPSAPKPPPLPEEVEIEPSRGTSAQLLARLPAYPLFTDVPQDALEELVRASEHMVVLDGTKLIARGEPADALFVVIAGEADVDVPGVPHVLPVDEGDVVGESCLLDGVDRQADVVARGELEALRFPREALDRAAERFPSLEGVLIELLGRRLVSNLLKTSPLFAGFDPSTRMEIAKLFEIRRATRGTVLLEKGKRGDGLFVVLQGAIDTDEEVAGPGGMFGHQALLSREPSEVSATAKTDSLLLRMPARRFNELAAMYPPALMAISQLADESDAVWPGGVVY